MTHPKDISGVWHGTYFFDLAEQRPADGGGVAFELRLTQSWLQRIFGTFRGSVTDDPTRGMSGTGTVRGKHSQTSLRFTKRMPVAEFTYNGKAVSLQQLFERHGLAYRAPRNAHPPILYVGAFTSDSVAAGTWVIEEGTIRISARRHVPLPRCTGTFTLTR